MIPTIEECSIIVQTNAINVATQFLKIRGMTFQEAGTLEEASKNFLEMTKRILEQDDLEGASSCLMQNHRFFNRPDYGEDAKTHAEMLWRLGDEYFYGKGRSEKAFPCYQLAVGLDPGNEEAFWETLSVCLQGNKFMPGTALPYAVLLARINPERDEVGYIVRLMERYEKSEDI